MTSPNIYKLNQKIHIGMMEVMDQNYTTLDQTLEQIASNEFTNPAVLQITQTNQNYVSLDCETDLEVNLIESEKKDILLAPAIDEELLILGASETPLNLNLTLRAQTSA